MQIRLFIQWSKLVSKLKKALFISCRIFLTLFCSFNLCPPLSLSCFHYEVGLVDKCW